MTKGVTIENITSLEPYNTIWHVMISKKKVGPTGGTNIGSPPVSPTFL